jgi:hypothetical protein
MPHSANHPFGTKSFEPKRGNLPNFVSPTVCSKIPYEIADPKCQISFHPAIFTTSSGPLHTFFTGLGYTSPIRSTSQVIVDQDLKGKNPVRS